MNKLDLEDLLLERSHVANTFGDILEDEKPTPEDNCEVAHGGTALAMQKANKGASIYDFLDMTALIVDHAMEHNVKFLTDEQENILKDPEIAFNQPHISYRILSRRPPSNREYKPIVREEIIECDELNEQRKGVIYGQVFDCIVQFTIFAGEAKLANKVVEDFENLMLSYTGYFKQQGVMELYFKEQVTDQDYNNFRETLSVRNVRYYVQIEKLAVIFNRKLDDVRLVGDAVETKK